MHDSREVMWGHQWELHHCSIVYTVGDSKDIQPVKREWWFVDDDELTGALQVLAPVFTTTSIIISSDKINAEWRLSGTDWPSIIWKKMAVETGR